MKNQKKTKKVSKFANNQFDFILFIVVLLLLGFGIIMVLSASAPSALATTGSSYTYLWKQAGAGFLGIVLMLLFSKIDYRWYKKYYWGAYVLGCAILLLVVIPGIGHSVKGATRWVQIGPLQLQPSELTKFAMIIFYAGYLTDHKDELGTLGKGFLKPLVFLVPPVAILFFVQNHLSVSLIISLVVLTMMFMAGCRLKYFLVVGVVVVSLIIGIFGFAQMAGSDNFRVGRVATFMDPWKDPQGKGYQNIQSLYAIGSGGFFGLGLGNSRQKYLYIPEPHNDFIFAILAEELGFVGCLIVIALFCVFIWRGILIAMKASDKFGTLMAVGITSLVAYQAIMNIAVVTASIPNTGVSLPFFSYGGTALVLLLMNVGILLNISRSNSKV